MPERSRENAESAPVRAYFMREDMKKYPLDMNTFLSSVYFFISSRMK